MRCEEARGRLTADGEAADRALADHLSACEGCASFERRVRVLERGLRAHHSVVEPPPAFTALVLGNLPGSPQVLGWAALRMLPATLALALVLLGWALLSTSTPGSLVEQAPSDDVLSWMYESEGLGS